MKKQNLVRLIILTEAFVLISLPLSAGSLGTSFTYQGRLSSGANAAAGLFDFSFALYDAISSGSQVGSTFATNAVPVTDGTFTVTLDFGSQFAGSALWLAVWVKTNGSGSYTPLAPRQAITATPYALYAPYAGSATLASSVATGSITSASLAPGAVYQLGTPGGTDSNALQVSANGFVGIGTGTNSPDAALEVAGGATIVAPVVFAEGLDGVGSFNNLGNAKSVAFSTNLLAIAARSDNAFTLIGTSGDTLTFRSSIANGQGAFTNITDACGVAFSTNNLLAVAAAASSAVTLVNVTNPSSPVWVSVLRDNVGPFSLLNGACAVAFNGNLLAVAAFTDNAVTLVNVSNPGSPTLAGTMQHSYNNFTNLTQPSALAFSGNILAIAAYGDNTVTLADLSNPASPTPRSVINAGSGFPMLGGPQAVAFNGTTLAIAAGTSNAVTLVDVSNPSLPTTLAVLRQGIGATAALRTPTGVAFMQLNGRTLLVVTASGSSSLLVFDVTTPTAPSLCGVFPTGQCGLHYLGTPEAVALNASNRLAIAASGSSAVTLLGLAEQKAGLVSDNWVGIGTTTPKAALDVKGDVLVENANRFQAQAPHIELGQGTTASGVNSTAMGVGTTARGNSSTAMGDYSTASGDGSTAMGEATFASANDSVAMGYATTASGGVSTAMGGGTIASGNVSTAMGETTTASGPGSTAMGFSTIASGLWSTAMGNSTTAGSNESTAMGLFTTASGVASIAMGEWSSAWGEGSAAMGNGTIAGGSYSTAMGQNTTASGIAATAMGEWSTARGEGSAAMGNGAIANGNYSTAMGENTTANGVASTAMGALSVTSNSYTMAVGHNAKAVHQGTFVWADSQGTDFTSTANDQFLIRAQGGVGVGKNNPASALDVNGTVTAASFNVSGAGLSGSLNVMGVASFSGNIVLNDKDIQLRTTYDHGLGWYGSTKPFAGVTVDGPVLYGYGGGGLATVHSGSSTNLVLNWNSAGNVGIGNNNPAYKLVVVNARCDGSSWINSSDRNLKEHFAAIDPQTVLAKVAALPVQSWSYKAHPDQKHLGPVAQDFHAAFGLGPDDVSIATVDEGGVALAAIQGLNQKVEVENASLRSQIRAKDAELAMLRKRLDRIEQLLNGNAAASR